MKKEIQNYINSLGGTSSYSGKTRTLYINDPIKDKQSIESCIYNKFGFDLTFKIITQ